MGTTLLQTGLLLYFCADQMPETLQHSLQRCPHPRSEVSNWLRLLLLAVYVRSPVTYLPRLFKVVRCCWDQNIRAVVYQVDAPTDPRAIRWEQVHIRPPYLLLWTLMGPVLLSLLLRWSLSLLARKGALLHPIDLDWKT